MTLSEFMSKSKVTESEIGRLAGCSQSTVNKLRHGRISPSLALARRISIATKGGVTPNDFAASMHGAVTADDFMPEADGPSSASEGRA